MPTLALYHYTTCPFCVRVRLAMKRYGVSAELRNIHADPLHLDALVEATGRRTVPVLRIEEADGSVRWLPESRDIVAYLADLTT